MLRALSSFSLWVLPPRNSYESVFVVIVVGVFVSSGGSSWDHMDAVPSGWGDKYLAEGQK